MKKTIQAKEVLIFGQAGSRLFFGKIIVYFGLSVKITPKKDSYQVVFPERDETLLFTLTDGKIECKDSNDVITSVEVGDITQFKFVKDGKPGEVGIIPISSDSDDDPGEKSGD